MAECGVEKKQKRETDVDTAQRTTATGKGQSSADDSAVALFGLLGLRFVSTVHIPRGGGSSSAAACYCIIPPEIQVVWY